MLTTILYLCKTGFAILEAVVLWLHSQTHSAAFCLYSFYYSIIMSNDVNDPLPSHLPSAAF